MKVLIGDIEKRVIQVVVEMESNLGSKQIGNFLKLEGEEIKYRWRTLFEQTGRYWLSRRSVSMREENLVEIQIETRQTGRME